MKYNQELFGCFKMLNKLKLFSKFKSIVFFTVLIIVSAIVIFINYQQSKQPSRLSVKTKAVGEGVKLILSTALTSTIAVGNNFSVTILMNTGAHQVSAASLIIAYDQLKLQAQRVDIGSALPLKLANATVSDGTVQLHQGSFLASPYKGAAGIVATIIFKAVSAGSSSIQVDFQSKIAAIGKTTSVLENTPALTVSVSSPKSAAAPVCVSWSNLWINNCTSLDLLTSGSSNCQTTNNIVTINNNVSGATRMWFINVEPSTYCSSIISGWSGPFNYQPQYSWSLSAGKGEKKVCVKLNNDAGEGVPCGGMIKFN